MKKEDKLGVEMEKLGQKIGKASSEKDELQKEYDRLKKEKESIESKKHLALYNNLFDELKSLMDEYDVDGIIYCDYFDCELDEHTAKQLIQDLTYDGDEPDTSIYYDWESVIGEEIERAKKEAEAYAGKVKMLEDFKKVIKEKEGKGK